MKFSCSGSYCDSAFRAVVKKNDSCAKYVFMSKMPWLPFRRAAMAFFLFSPMWLAIWLYGNLGKNFQLEKNSCLLTAPEKLDRSSQNKTTYYLSAGYSCRVSGALFCRKIKNCVNACGCHSPPSLTCLFSARTLLNFKLSDRTAKFSCCGIT